MQLAAKEAMLLAIAEAAKGAGFVSPNPLVGCVILDRDGQLLATGYHARVGEAHAEVNALAAVQDKSRLDGAHVFVTLEPCAHQGRTPSCARTLAALPISAVTFGLVDPDPRVRGQGAEILRQAGKTVELYSDLQDELSELCEIFLKNQRHHRPFVAMKVAASLDGKVALSDGTSQWITGEESRAHVQYLRGCYDAVLIGVGTFLKDHPRLNPRDPKFKDRRSRVVLLDPEGLSVASLGGSRLLEVRAPEDVIVFTGPDVKIDVSVRHHRLSVSGGEFDLREVLQKLRAENIHSLFIEGGATTYASFLRQRLVDRLYLFQAPRILGAGLSWSQGLQINSLTETPHLTSFKSQTFGVDTFFTGRLRE